MLGRVVLLLGTRRNVRRHLEESSSTGLLLGRISLNFNSELWVNFWFVSCSAHPLPLQWSKFKCYCNSSGKGSLLHHANSDCGKLWLSPFLSFFRYQFFYCISSQFSYWTQTLQRFSSDSCPSVLTFPCAITFVSVIDQNYWYKWHSKCHFTIFAVTLLWIFPSYFEFLPDISVFLKPLFLQEQQCFSQQVKLFPFQVFAEQLITMSSKSNDPALSEKQWKLFHRWECVTILIKCKIILITSNSASRIGSPFIQINEQTIQIPKQQKEMELSCL